MMNDFKCPYCEKIYPTTICSNFMSKGEWVCKPCYKTFEVFDTYVEDIDQQAFAQGRRSSYDNGK